MSAQHPPVADGLTARLRAVAYGTTFLDVRADILALIERDDRNRMDGIAACELLAVSRARCAVLLETLRRIAGAPAWGAPERWETTPAEVRQLARQAISLATGESQ